MTSSWWIENLNKLYIKKRLSKQAVAKFVTVSPNIPAFFIDIGKNSYDLATLMRTIEYNFSITRCSSSVQGRSVSTSRNRKFSCKQNISESLVTISLKDGAEIKTYGISHSSYIRDFLDSFL